MSFFTSASGSGRSTPKCSALLGHGVAVELIGELSEDRAAEGQVTQVIFERGKAGNSLSADTEGGHAIGDHLLCLRNDLEDRPAQCLQGAALGLLEPA
jgi:hypothetical protein